MVYIYLILIYLFVYGYLFYFNRKDRDYDLGFALFYSFLESLVGFGILNLIPLNVAFPTFLSIFISSVIVAGLLLARFYIRLRGDDHDLERIEGLKNMFLHFGTTLLPFMICLTIFRFSPIYIQVPLALLCSGITMFLSRYTRTLGEKVFGKDFHRLQIFGHGPNYPVIAIVVVLLFVVFFVNVPNKQIEQLLNINEHVPQYSYNNGVTNYDNSFSQEFQYDREEVINRSDYPFFEEDPLEDSVTFYDIENNITYVAKHNYDRTTTYEKIYENGHVSSYTVNGYHNLYGYVAGGVVYLTHPEVPYIEIMDNEFKFTDRINLDTKYNVFKWNRYYNFIAEYHVYGDSLYVTQYETKNTEAINIIEVYETTYKITQHDVDFNFGFYAKISMYQIYIMVFTMFIPITHWNKRGPKINFRKRKIF